MNHRRWRETAEYFMLASSGVGAVAAAVSQQFLFAAAPISCLLALNLVNRQRFEQETKQLTKLTITRLDSRVTREIAYLQEHIEGLPSVVELDSLKQNFFRRHRESLNRLSEQVQTLQWEMQRQLAPLKAQDVAGLRQDLEQMQIQHTQVATALEQVTDQLAQLTAHPQAEQTEAAIARLQADMAQAQADLKLLSNEPMSQVKGLQDQVNHINRRLNHLPTPFDASSLKQDVESLIRVIAGLVPRREFTRALVDLENLQHKYQGLEQSVAPLRLAITIFRKQLDVLHSKVHAPGEAHLLEELSQTVAAMEARLSQLPTLPDLADLQDQIQAQASLGPEVAQLRQQMSTVQRNTEALYQQHKALRDWIHRLPQLLDNSALQSQLQSLAARLEGVEGNMVEVRGELEATLQKRLGGINQQLQALPGMPNHELVIALRSTLPASSDRPEPLAGSRAFLEELLDQAENQVIVVWPWPNPFSLDAALLEKFRAFLQRGGCLSMGWSHLGMTHQSYAPRYISPRSPISPPERSWLHNTLKQLAQLKQEFPQQFKFKILGADENFLVCDRRLAILKIPNLPVSSTVFPELELGLRTTDAQTIQGLIDRFEQPLLDVNDATAYFQRAATRYEIGDKSGAIADYTQVLQIDPHNDVAYTNRGVARYDLGDSAEAMTDFDQAIQRNPDNSVAYCNRGFICAELGDKLGAIEDYSQAIALSPDDATTYFYRGVARTRIGNKLGAIEDYTQAIGLHPEDATAYLYRGLARAKLGDNPRAIADLQQAEQLFSDRGDLLNRRKAQGTLKKLQQAVVDANLINC
ncbi:tetratricopeptide repeat protein [Trichocoleus sp. FACHB-262]|uniref:tetratricopeptide repeat protein n=1 Tax=Trichocoleus sp. FACHB-262 TaxID=2692869 RepID=UPI001689B434|nr:tetratricopeptide repeat protein [Trichocoleus sp. FACHB-262]MBD2122017.1 tetratricopeptide repeat protein [Trichocoleus sp. FACHB-262]